VDLIAGMVFEPMFYKRVFVCAVVIQDEVDVEPGIGGSLYFVEE